MNKLKSKIKNFFKMIGTLIAVGGIFAVIGAYFLFPFIVLGVIVWVIFRIT